MELMEKCGKIKAMENLNFGGDVKWQRKNLFWKNIRF